MLLLLVHGIERIVKWIGPKKDHELLLVYRTCTVGWNFSQTKKYIQSNTPSRRVLGEKKFRGLPKLQTTSYPFTHTLIKYDKLVIL